MKAPVAFGRYVLLDQLATGGMAEIFLAKFQDQGRERTCVVKRVLPHLGESEEFVGRFLDEARIAAQLIHPGIVQILDLGRQGADLYFAMEYLAGEDLGALLWQCRVDKRTIPLDVALQIASRSAAALQHAHEARAPDGKPLNVVHRDVSPSNIFVTYDDQVKLLDFGIARADQRSYETQVGQIKGKAAYMSPEQTLGLSVDRRADIWALGVCVYEMLTGEFLFARETPLATFEAVREAPIPTLREKRPSVPEALSDVVAKAMERDGARRLATAAEFQRVVDELLQEVVTHRQTPGEFLREVFGAERAEQRLRLHQVPVGGPAQRVATEDIIITHHGDSTLPTFPGGDPTPAARPRVLRDLRGTDPIGPSPEAEVVSTRVLTSPWTPRVTGVIAGSAAGLIAAAGIAVWIARPASKSSRPTAVEARTEPMKPVVLEPVPEPPPPLTPAPVAAVAPPGPPAAAGAGSRSTGEPAKRTHESTRSRKIALAEERRSHREAPPPPPPPPPAFLTLESNESATVSVDGSPIGALPIRHLKLNPGEHKLHLENRSLGLVRTVHVTLKPGEDLVHRESFQKGKLNVMSQPWADVFVDGHKLGTTPLAQREVWEGHHEVRLVGPQSEKTIGIDVVAGQTAVIKEKLP